MGEKTKFAFIDIETLSPQRRLKVTDVITGIGIKTEDATWIEVLEPSGGRNTDIDEANLIFEAAKHLGEVKPDILTGCYIWGFDLPRLLSRTLELDYDYERTTGKKLRLELERTLNGLRIIDLARIDYITNELAQKYGKSYLSTKEICNELGIETKTFPANLHVWVSAKVIAGDPAQLKERLNSDLREGWGILQALLSQDRLQV